MRSGADRCADTTSEGMTMKAKTQKSRPVAPASARKHAAKPTPPEARKVVRRTIETARAASGEAQSEIADLGEGNLAAVVHANAVMIKGLEAIGQEVFGYAQHSLESAMSAARAMIDARGLVDVIALNREFAQTALESFFAKSVRLSEIGIKTTSEALAPLGQRVAQTQEKIGRPNLA
jgi:phasin family protein